MLVAVDFNGTLSPFVLDPLQARAAATLGGVIAGAVSRVKTKQLQAHVPMNEMMRQPAGSGHWHGQESLVAAGWVQPMSAGAPCMRMAYRGDSVDAPSRFTEPASGAPNTTPRRANTWPQVGMNGLLFLACAILITGAS